MTLTEEQWNSLIELAVEHRVAPLFYYHILRQQKLETTESANALYSLRNYSRQVAKNNLRYYGELHRLLNEFHQADTPVILLKGIFLAHVIYDDIGLREMNDIDILVKRSDVTPAFHTLSDLGYKSVPTIDSDGIPNLISRHHHIPPMVKENTATIEVHWNITSPGESYTIDPEVVWRDAQPITISGKPAMMLSPEDLLLHLCVHTSYQHNFSFGLRPFVDIAEVVNHFGGQIDWDNVIKRAFRFRWDRGVFLALTIARDFTGAKIPADILAALKSNDYDEAILNTAKEQILTKKRDSNSISAPMIEFTNQKSLKGKFTVVLNRIFPSRKFMEFKYSLQPGTPKLYAYYIFRFWRLFNLHARNLFQLSRGDEKLSGIAKRKQTLKTWMNNPSS